MHDSKVHRPDRRQLFERASTQAGYFTSGQARACGYGKSLLSYHARRGNFVRAGRGLYRLSEYPSFPREEVMAAWLAAGGAGALVSHESALDLLDISDVIPDKIHITIGRDERWRRPPPGVMFHTTTTPVPRSQFQIRDGLKVATAARAIVDSAVSGVSPEQIFSAIASSLERGLTTRSELLGLGRARGGLAEHTIGEGIQAVTE